MRSATTMSRSTARRAITASPPYRAGRSRRSSAGSSARSPTAATSRCGYEAGGRSILLHNFYVPAGGDEPDPEVNPKFRHKLGFVSEMNAVRADFDDLSGSILVGDLNIAPLEHDVWSHKQLLKVVSHTPVETEGFEAMRESGGWVDLMRLNVPYEQKLYTWWSYRAADWAASDRGRRLDHIWSSAESGPRPRRHRHFARRTRLGPPLRPRAGHRPFRFRLELADPSRLRGGWPRSGRVGLPRQCSAQKMSRTSGATSPRFASQIDPPRKGRNELSPGARRPPRSSVSTPAGPR